MTLLKEMPQLKGDARQHYIDIVTGAHWLEPVDRALLFAYVVACEMHSEASRELSRCMNDPAFSDPTTDISKAGIEYNKICSRQAQMIFRLSDELLLNPMARAKAGVEVRDASEPPNAWAKFLKIDGGRKDDPPA